MKNKMNLPTEISSLLAEEIGWHLGDGSMNYYKGKGFYQLRGHIQDDKGHYLTRIRNVYKTLFNIDVSLREMPSTGVYGFQIWSTKLVDYKNKIIGLPLGKKECFSIPTKIFQNKKLSVHFLRGYFDTDGCLYLEKRNGKLYPRVEMASISEKFIQQLKEVLEYLGFKLSYYIERRQKHGWQDLHRIIIRGNNMVEKWFSEIKPANPKHLKKFNKLKSGSAEI